MFDYIAFKRKSDPLRPRYMTAGVSAAVHVIGLGLAVGLPILYASEKLPEPPDMLAFVVAAPLPPPPPAPPKPPEAKKAEPAAAAKPSPLTPKPLPPSPAVAAPVEAPSEVAPEPPTQPVAAAGRPAAVEAGFEGGVAGGLPGGTVGGVESAAPPPPPPPPPPPKPQGPVRVGGNIKQPQLVKRVEPAYPAMAQSAQVEGTVVLEATVDKSGRVQSVRVVRGQALLDSAAIAAVKQWQYEPLMLNGEPVPFILTVTMSFSMPR